MIGAPKLFSRILARDLPPRALRYALLNLINRWLRTGDNRFAFERLYLEKFDPWQMRSSAYEREKYRRTLDRILETRRGSERVLEVGCSVGSFTRMLTGNFEQVVAIDFSDEAIARAADYCRDSDNVQFIRSDLQSLKLDSAFDVIVCAEILYYIAKRQAPAVCAQLQHLLAPKGIIATVCGAAPDFWDATLSRKFRPVLKDIVSSEVRPYKIALFEHS